MTPPPANRHELQSLSFALSEGTLGAEQAGRLGALLAADPAAREVFARSALLQAMLELELGGAGKDGHPARPTPTTQSPVLGFLGDAWRGTAGFFSEGFPLAYLLATAIVGTAIGIASLIPVQHHVELTRRFGPAPTVVEQPDSVLPAADQTARGVARVTALVDCKWETEGLGIRDWGLDKGSGVRGQGSVLPSPAGRGAGGEGQSPIPNPQSLVHLGDKFALASGLLQLTYDTGAKVILQGPCTYEVDSPAGGFLSVGKLTARVESGGKKVASGQWLVASDKSQIPNPKSQISKSQISNPQSLIPNPSLPTTHYPLFTIKTPTAVVTDLGTEFGVEVRNGGFVSTHVFRGTVEVQLAAGDGWTQPVRLADNQSLQVAGQQDDQPSRAIRGTADAAAFVRGEQLLQLARAQRTRDFRAPPLRWPILDKTLVAWVSLDNLDQQGGSPLSLVNMPEFDGIVFGEIEPCRWMAGSHGYSRTQQEQSHYPAETAAPGKLVQIAVVYGAPNVSIYRNGQLYAEHPVLNQITFDENSIVLIGKRHMDDLGKVTTFAGAIEEARLYDVALTPKQIASLRPGDPAPVGPVGWWTFEDGTARDVAGHFAIGELHGNARIADGRLILDGQDSYLLAPATVDTSKQKGGGDH